MSQPQVIRLVVLRSRSSLKEKKLILRKGKCKELPVQAWTGPEGSRRWRLQTFQSRYVKVEGGKVVSTVHRPPLPEGNIPDTHLRYRLSRPQIQSAARRIMSMKNSNDIIESATFRPVAQCLNQVRYRLPRNIT